MSVVFSSTKITNASEKVDTYLNIIYKLKDKIGKDEVEFMEELVEDIESWRTCIDEIELSIKSFINTEDNNEYTIDKENKEIIIY
jgi:arginyl-tRNA synthetase